MRWILLFLAVLTLSGCDRPAQKVSPALWLIEGAQGQRGWLFGTIHALPDPVDWQSRPLDQAMAQSGLVAVEIADIDHAARDGKFRELASSPNLAPADQRAGADFAAATRALADAAGQRLESLRTYETWAIALLLAGAAQPDADPANGIDRAVISSAHDRHLPVVELEGAPRQFAIFDTLPEPQQTVLLRSIVAGAGKAAQDGARLAYVWGKGDVASIAAETNRGVLADPMLRRALLLDRNRDWSARIVAMIERGKRPFVAVGAAHLAGPDGIPAMLAAHGYRVSRIQ